MKLQQCGHSRFVVVAYSIQTLGLVSGAEAARSLLLVTPKPLLSCLCHVVSLKGAVPLAVPWIALAPGDPPG